MSTDIVCRMVYIVAISTVFSVSAGLSGEVGPTAMNFSGECCHEKPHRSASPCRHCALVRAVQCREPGRRQSGSGTGPDRGLRILFRLSAGGMLGPGDVDQGSLEP